ncbi:MAG: Uma2 family endonuclease [Desulfobacterales bacterium]|nr:Uma2 family endonuclease [Desulfobacterales bacterium]
MQLAYESTYEYTPQEYLEIERKAVYKSEYLNGFILGMAGASRQHNQITFNICVEIGLQLKKRSCNAYANDMRVKISQTGLYTYPDVVATCKRPEFEDVYMDTLLNPALIIEVLSGSTEAYDRGEKFAHYRRLPAFKEYLLVAQDRICIEQYVREHERWILTETNDIEGMVHLNSIDCNLSIKEIYDKV